MDWSRSLFRSKLHDGLDAFCKDLFNCLGVGSVAEINQQLRDEIAQLKGQKPRPDIKPSVLEARKPKTEGQDAGKRPGSAKRPKTAELAIHREVALHAEGLSVGATFRGYEAYVVQELQINESHCQCGNVTWQCDSLAGRRNHGTVALDVAVALFGGKV